MTKYGQQNTLKLMLFLTLFTGNASMSEELKIGDTLVCESDAGLPPVYAFIGKVDSVEELSRSGSILTESIISAQLFTLDESRFPVVGHSPFLLRSFANCEAAEATAPRADRDRFAEGYETWREAYDKGEAGVWDIEITKAYWAILGVITGY